MNEPVLNSTLLHVRMLGCFEMEKNGCVISDKDSRSRQLWNLLEYLVAHRHKDISQSELIEVLWPDDTSDHPAGALKNLIYRVRTMLEDSGIPGGKDIVELKNGAYSLKKDDDIVIDVEEFEKLTKAAELFDITEDRRTELCLKAIAIYGGDFLPRSSSEPWAVPVATYYHSRYLICVNRAIELLKAKKDYEQIVIVCEKALLIDRFEERLYEELIRALIALNKQKRAMTCYQKASEMFYKEMSVKLSESLRSLYREIIKTINAVETDLDVIKEDLREASEARGAFLCEYEIFKNMYQLEARSAARTSQAVFVALVTIMPSKGDTLTAKAIEDSIEKLQEALLTSLRRGDVISRFSATQFVIMLPSLTIENGEMVLNRVSRRFSAIYSGHLVKLSFALQPLDPLAN